MRYSWDFSFLERYIYVILSEVVKKPGGLIRSGGAGALVKTLFSAIKMCFTSLFFAK